MNQRLIKILNLQKHIKFFNFSRKEKSKNSFKIENNNLDLLYKIDEFDNLDALIHVAGFIPEPESKDDLYSCIDVNAGLTKILIDFSIEKKYRSLYTSLLLLYLKVF